MKGDQWQRDNVRTANANFQAFREKLNQERREHRMTLTLNERIKDVLGALQSIQHSSAQSIGRSSRSVERSSPRIDPTIGQLEPRVYKQLVTNLVLGDDDMKLKAVEGLEHAIDDHRGYLRFEALQTTEDRNSRLLRDFEGYSPEDVHRIDTTLGRPDTVRKIRANAELDPETGRPKATRNP